MLRIAEIFASVQGEGLRLGEATIFVRLAGCNLRCPFCDTPGARSGGRPMSEAAVVAAVRRLHARRPSRWVCLTGGEPLAQDVGLLTAMLKEAGWDIQAETNGTIWRPVPIDWITLSPKPPRWDYDPRFRRRAREVKIVVTKGLPLSAVLRLRSEFPARVPLFLQPESNRRDRAVRAVRLAARAARAGAGPVRVGVQLHRVFDFR